MKSRMIVICLRGRYKKGKASKLNLNWSITDKKSIEDFPAVLGLSKHCVFLVLTKFNTNGIIFI